MDDGQRPETKPSRAPISVSVVCGHLAFASYPVFVGHYDGDTFAGTEARLDEVLDGRLTARRQMGLYPGSIGSSTVVLDCNARPPGAVVVGLGEPASLTVAMLRRTLRRGFLALATTVADRIASDASTIAAERAIRLSTLLIGAGEGGLDRTSCAQALLQAMADAQDLLARVSKGAAFLVAVEIIELYEGLAAATWRDVAQILQTDPTLAGNIEVASGLRQRPGARKAAPVGRDATWWQPIQITMSGQARNRGLTFTLGGGLARAEARTVAANLDLVTPLVRRVSRSGINNNATDSPGRALFELLWPAALKDHSADERPRRLILDERSAGFPWELLDDRRPWMSDEANLKPPAVRAGMVRQLLQTRFREDLVTTQGTPKALVIGNPKGAPTGMVDLPQAEAEAIAIAAMLGGPPYVTLLAGAAAAPELITRALFTDAWEIIHISAHGVSNQSLPGSDGKKEKRTGIVLGGGAVLDPSALAKIPVSPGIAFINCCHLGVGSVDLDGRPQFAANIAIELIRLGARCVIAAGWAIDDDVAAAFGKTFYQAMLEGRTFGEATLLARQAAYRVNPNSSTFGAYQCYGDPDYRLRGALRRRGEGESAPSFVTVSEAIEAVARIRDDLNIGLERKLDSLKQRLGAIEDAAKTWLGNAELRVALAEAWGELGDLPKAIEHYTAAVGGQDTSFKVRAIEQLANLSVRQAVATLRALAPEIRDPAKTAAEIHAWLSKIESLTDMLGRTPERYSLQAGCWKRLAQIQPDDDGAAASLTKMAEGYDRATEIATARNKPYSQLNACVARICLAVRAGAKVDDGVQAQLKALIDAVPPEEADFWDLILWADARTADVILNSDVALDDGKLIAAYERAWRHIGSPVKLKSVIEQLEFYEDIFVFGAPSTQAKRDGIRALAAKLKAALQAESLKP